MSDYYLWIKLAHILAAVVVMGTGSGIAFFMWMTSRTGNVQAIATTAKLVVLADWLFTAPGVVVQVTTGVMLMNILGYSFSSPWFYQVIGLYALVGCLWLPVIKIQYALREQADLSAEQNHLTDKFKYLMKWWFWLGVPAFIAMLGLFYLMVIGRSQVY